MGLNSSLGSNPSLSGLFCALNNYSQADFKPKRWHLSYPLFPHLEFCLWSDSFLRKMRRSAYKAPLSNKSYQIELFLEIRFIVYDEAANLKLYLSLIKQFSKRF
jgi:hypothetical protein